MTEKTATPIVCSNHLQSSMSMMVPLDKTCKFLYVSHVHEHSNFKNKKLVGFTCIKMTVHSLYHAVCGYKYTE